MVQRWEGGFFMFIYYWFISVTELRLQKELSYVFIYVIIKYICELISRIVCSYIWGLQVIPAVNRQFDNLFNDVFRFFYFIYFFYYKLTKAAFRLALETRTSLDIIQVNCIWERTCLSQMVQRLHASPLVYPLSLANVEMWSPLLHQLIKWSLSTCKNNWELLSPKPWPLWPAGL